MKSGLRTRIRLCCLGSLLLGSMAVGQPERAPERPPESQGPRRPREPRSVVVQPSAAKARKGDKARSPRVARRFWADYDAKSILCGNLDGSQVQVVASNVEGPYGISYDQATDSILWTSAGDELVQMSSASDYENGISNVITLNSSLEEYFAIVVNGSEQNVAYGVEAGQVIKLTQNRDTGAEQREVLFTLSSPDAVHGLALAPDHSALYLGDSVGRMSHKLHLSTRQLRPLLYDNGPVLSPAPSEPILAPVEAP
jgi:hypothetical protein